MKKVPILIIAVVVVIVGAALIFSQNNKSASNSTNTEKNTTSQEDSKFSGQASEIKTTRPMMGQESFSLSVCDEVPKEIVASIIGKEIVDIKDHSDGKTTGCTYFINKQTLDNIVIVVAYMDPNAQKKFYESGGKEIKVLSEIPMNNFSIWDKGQIGGIYLIMADKKYVRVERSNPKVTGNQEEITLAKRVAEIILTGK